MLKIKLLQLSSSDYLMDQTYHSALDAGLLTDTVQPTAQYEIRQAFWNLHHYEQQRLCEIPLDLDRYWSFYTQECEAALHDGGRHLALRTHRDVVEVGRKMVDGLHRKELTDFIKSKLTNSHANEQEMLDNSIDLVASLILMTRFGTRSYGFSGQSQIRWVEGRLEEHVNNFFRDTNVLETENVKLEKNFNGQNLVRIAGIQILWTDNLADHLRLTEDDQRVHIFHHASFLEAQRQSLLPVNLAEETLQTLALLFPSSDANTRKWFLNYSTSKQLDCRVIRCGRIKTDNRKIDKFAFWRDRLITLKQVFDEAQPKTISQWWHDRRNGVQWYTFWVAVLVLVLTIFFGLVQSIEGAIQSYASLKALAAVPESGKTQFQ